MMCRGAEHLYHLCAPHEVQALAQAPDLPSLKGTVEGRHHLLQLAAIAVGIIEDSGNTSDEGLYVPAGLQQQVHTCVPGVCWSKLHTLV